MEKYLRKKRKNIQQRLLSLHTRRHLQISSMTSVKMVYLTFTAVFVAKMCVHEIVT